MKKIFGLWRGNVTNHN